MLEIQTNRLKGRKKVLIDGHPYTVRKFGAGEQLTLNQYLRRGEKLDKLMTSQSATDSEKAEAEEIASKLIGLFASLFDDGLGGEKSRELVSSLGVDEIQELFTQIFSEAKYAEPDIS